MDRQRRQPARMARLATHLFMLTMIASGSELAAGPEIQYGPPWSPLAVRDAVSGKQQKISVQENILGVAMQPTSVRLVELHDENPYGVERSRTVRLARYDSVPVLAPDSSYSASVPISLAFDAAKNELLCAFTDPAPSWPRSRAGLKGIESHCEDCEFSPARHDSLQSSVIEVLRKLWDTFHIDPTKAGQIIIRPRFVTRGRPARISGTEEIVTEWLPSNVWVIEVLGTVVVSRRPETPCTSLVAHYHDEARQIILGYPLP